MDRWFKGLMFVILFNVAYHGFKEFKKSDFYKEIISHDRSVDCNDLNSKDNNKPAWCDALIRKNLKK